MRWRTPVIAAAGLIGLVLGVWVMDWWSLESGGVEVHANLRRIEACRGDRCTGGETTGFLSLAVLVGGTLLAVITALIVGLRFTGVTVGRTVSRLHLTIALLVLAGASTMLAITPDGLTGAGFAIGGWVTVISSILCVVSALAFVAGDDPLGEGRLYRPVKVEVPAAVLDENAKYAGATIPPFAIAQRTGKLTPPMAALAAATARQGTGSAPPWQPAIKDIAHVEAPAPRRSSTRAPFTAPPPFDAARQALRFVVAEAALGPDAITVTLEDHRKIELPWNVFNRASARQLPAGAPFDKLIVVDLCTIGGAPLRFLPSSRVNYADLPGGAAPNSRENLRRLVAHVKTKQPTFGVEHDSAAFFAGGREPPAFGSLKQFVAYDEQYAGVIGSIPDS